MRGPAGWAAVAREEEPAWDGPIARRRRETHPSREGKTHEDCHVRLVQPHARAHDRFRRRLGASPLERARARRQSHHAREGGARQDAVPRPAHFEHRERRLRLLPQRDGGGTDNRSVSMGVHGKTGRRNAPTGTRRSSRRSSGTAVPRAWKTRRKARSPTRSKWA